MEGYVAKRVDDKIPLPAPVSHHPRFKTKFRETTRFYQLALFMIPLGTLFIAIGVFIPRWMDVQIFKFVTLSKDYSIGLWEKCDTLKEKCSVRLDSSLKGACVRGSFVPDCVCLNCSFLLNPRWRFVYSLIFFLKDSITKSWLRIARLFRCCHLLTTYRGRTRFDRLAVHRIAGHDKLI